MLPSHRHVPVLDSARKRCPVCNHAVYSAAGIHPQCAIRQSDPPHAERKKLALAEAAAADAPVIDADAAEVVVAVVEPTPRAPRVFGRGPGRKATVKS